MSTTTEVQRPKKDKKAKKPYHVSRADLDLPTYIEEQNAKSPRVLWNRFLDHTIYSFQFKLYVVVQIVAASLGLGQLMLIIGLGWMMLANTTKRKEGEKSAYSLFNPGVEGSVLFYGPFHTAGVG
jgi:hypothetical protein